MELVTPGPIFTRNQHFTLLVINNSAYYFAKFRKKLYLILWFFEKNYRYIVLIDTTV